MSTFVRDNRAGVKTNVDQLASVTSTVAKQRDALAETLTNAPVAVSNLQNAYNPRTGTLDTRSNMEQFDDPALLLCSLVTGPTGTGNTDLCKDIDGLVRPLAGRPAGRLQREAPAQPALGRARRHPLPRVRVPR